MELPQNLGEPIDVQILVRLAAANPDRYTKYATLFQQSMEEVLALVDTACVQRDIGALEAMGHRGKSTAMNMGASALSRQCLLLELAGKARDMETALATAIPLRPLYNQMCEALRAHAPRISK